MGLTNLSARSVPRFTCLKGTQTTIWSSPGPQEPYCEVQAAGKCAQLFPFLSSTSSLWSLSLPLLLIAFSLLSFLPVLSQPRIKATLGKRSCEPSLVNIYSLTILICKGPIGIPNQLSFFTFPPFDNSQNQSLSKVDMGDITSSPTISPILPGGGRSRRMGCTSVTKMWRATRPTRTGTSSFSRSSQRVWAPGGACSAAR